MEKAGKGLIVAGYIFSILGGLIGLAIGIYLLVSKNKETGEKKFDDASRKQGTIMLIIAIIVIVIGNVLRFAIQ